MNHLLKEKLRSKIEGMKRQLEMVYKTSANTQQRKRVSLQLGRLQKDLKLLDEDAFGNADVKRYLTDEELDRATVGDEQSDAATMEILSNIEIEQASPNCRQEEVNAISTYLHHFDREYWGVMSNSQLKLDFNYSQKRDSFFTKMNQLQIALKNYLAVLDDLAGNIIGQQQEQRLKQMKSRQYMDFIVKAGDFVTSLKEFVLFLLDEYRDGGNVVLNPEHVIQFDDLYGSKRLNGMRLMDALEEMRLFLEEFEQYLNIPELKQFQANRSQYDEDEE